MIGRNQLWKPEGNKPKFGIRMAPKRDPLCEYCPKKKSCSPGPCFFLSRINGNAESKEVLISDLCDKEMEFKDYKESLAELIEDREIAFSKINTIQPYKIRAIAAMLYVDIPKAEVARLLRISRTTLYRVKK